jgi:hypothetical protein
LARLALPHRDGSTSASYEWLVPEPQADCAGHCVPAHRSRSPIQ